LKPLSANHWRGWRGIDEDEKYRLILGSVTKPVNLNSTNEISSSVRTWKAERD